MNVPYVVARDQLPILLRADTAIVRLSRHRQAVIVIATISRLLDLRHQALARRCTRVKRSVRLLWALL